ncbi:acyl carrier protein [Actinomadura sp. KC216]|uniref:acyl carrier protein n=1 Tax=Actinomadura sp. KC216 TaxID=2530370 RepID=UPI001050BA83|nr:acyl carrier protein [Actinomadura sp. KC216]TDB91178.1 acyl carrier protein [Actinomadura sp. KC216]
MTAENISNTELDTTIRRALAEVLSIHVEQVTPSVNLVEDLGLDSLDSAEVAVILRERGIPLTKSAILQVATPAELITLATDAMASS